MDRLEILISQTIKDLETIMDVTPKQAAKDVVKKAIGRSVRSKDPLFWPAGMLVLGLSETYCMSKDMQGKLSKDLEERILSSVDSQVKLWKSRYSGRITHVDDALFGYGLIKLYEKTGDNRYRIIIDEIYEYLKNSKRDMGGSIIYNASKGNTNIFADGTGQACLFLAADILLKMRAEENSFEDSTQTDVYYFNDSDYITEISHLYTQLVNFYLFGRDKRSGLIYHGYTLYDDSSSGKFRDYTVDASQKTDSDNKWGDDEKLTSYVGKNLKSNKKGLLGWGRAVGWLMMGISEAAGLEMALKKKNEGAKKWAGVELFSGYKELTGAALQYQRDDGGWSWQIQAVEGHIDMSATGMIAYSIAKGLKAGLFDDTEKDRVKKALLKAKECMYAHSVDGKVTDALSSCDDFAVHYQTYGHYPWGQGAVLAALILIEQVTD